MAYGSGVAKGVAKSVGHVVFGSLPEQGFLEERIKWYNSDNGVLAGSAVETLGGLLAAAFFPEYANWLIAEAVAGGVRGGLEAEKTEMMNDAKRRGAYALEVPYFLGKKLVLGTMDLARAVRDGSASLRDYFSRVDEI